MNVGRAGICWAGIGELIGVGKKLGEDGLESLW